jgi:hypothetical protein
VEAIALYIVSGAIVWAVRVALDSDLEKQVWLCSSQVLGDSLSEVLREGLMTYKRAAGFDDLTRFHESIAGREVLMVLKRELQARWPRMKVDDSEMYIELRSRLRSYLYQYLLSRVVLEQRGTPVLRDALLASDLGL